MRSPLSEILDGAIGFIEPGYRAPIAKVNIDEAQEADSYAEEKRKVLPRAERNRLKQQTAEVRKALGKILRAISSQDSPIPARELWLRLKRPDLPAARVGSILWSMANRGEVKRTIADYDDGHGARVWLYWVERKR